MNAVIHFSPVILGLNPLETADNGKIAQGNQLFDDFPVPRRFKWINKRSNHKFICIEISHFGVINCEQSFLSIIKGS